MKSESDNGIDQWLRKYARQEGAGASASIESESIHLDADELSAFAENALPVAIRAQYFNHLADCDRCRHIVAGIASAANIAGELEKSAVGVAAASAASEPIAATTHLSPTHSSSWTSRLAAFFSSPALRYAVPLLAFVIIGALVWRVVELPSSLVRPVSAPQRGSSSEQAKTTDAPIAQSSQPQPSGNEPAAASGEMEMKRSVADNAPATANKGSDKTSDQIARADKKTTSLRGEVSSAAPPPSSSASDARIVQPQPMPRAAGAPRESERTKDFRAGANSAVLSKSDDAARDTNQKASQTAEKPKQENRAAPESIAELSDTASADETAGKRRTQNPSAPSASRPLARHVTEEAKEKAAAAQPGFGGNDGRAADETRNVVGRSFIRRDGKWIDRAYRDGQAVTEIKRNSEQYRALIADEPSLGTIAAQLSGDCIVVWKNRAYRFR